MDFQVIANLRQEEEKARKARLQAEREMFLELAAGAIYIVCREFGSGDAHVSVRHHRPLWDVDDPRQLDRSGAESTYGVAWVQFGGGGYEILLKTPLPGWAMEALSEYLRGVGAEFDPHLAYSHVGWKWAKWKIPPSHAPNASYLQLEKVAPHHHDMVKGLLDAGLI